MPLNIPENLIAWLVPVVILAVVILPNAVRILREYSAALFSASASSSGPRGRGWFS